MAVSHLHMDEERLDTHYVFLNQPSATDLILQKKKKNDSFISEKKPFFSSQNQMCDANANKTILKNVC